MFFSTENRNFINSFLLFFWLKGLNVKITYFQFRRLNINETDAVFSISITVFTNYLKWK